jgi:endonuclease/exonuclease/phosphatase (EEP) superfamily protein YafD
MGDSPAPNAHVRDLERKGIIVTKPRRLSVAATAFLALAVSLPGAGSAASAAPTARNPARAGSAPSSFSVVTYNVRHALSDATAAADLQKLAASGVDVMGLQEMGSGTRRAAVRNLIVDCDTCAFRAAWPNGTGQAEVPILFRDSVFSLVSKGTEKISDATYVGPRGAGPSRMAPKYLNYAELQHRDTGQIVYVINNHTVPSVQGPNGGPNQANAARLRLYRMHMQHLRDMISRFKAMGAAVVTTGDFNVNYRRDVTLQSKMFPYYNMKQIGVYASYRTLGMPARGTQNNRNGINTRIIDYVSALDSPVLKATAQEIMSGYRSDHRPVRVSYDIASFPGAPLQVTAEPLERSARVSWSAPADNGSRITGYTVTVAQTGAQITVPGEVTSATVSGLTAGSDYTFTVRATNALGTGPQSPESGAVVPVAVPPGTSITGGPRNGGFVTSSSATFAYDSTEPGSSFACVLDGVEQPCSAPSTTFSSLTQTTHEFAATATDPEGDVDPTPATRWWTVPLDGTAFSHGTRWSLGSGRAYYGGAYLQATRHGATLRRDVADLHKLALVATRGPDFGTVDVYLGDTLLKHVDLSAHRLARGRVVPIARFDTAQTGQVRVVVTSRGRTVRVEGLGVATR